MHFVGLCKWVPHPLMSCKGAVFRRVAHPLGCQDDFDFYSGCRIPLTFKGAVLNAFFDCPYTHDDLVRIASGNCGSIWSQTFGCDAFGNITKSGSSQFQPGYNRQTNQMSASSGTSYDLNGDVLNHQKNQTYEISGAVERRKFLYANLLLLKAYLRHGCHEIGEKSSKVVPLGAPFLIFRCIDGIWRKSPPFALKL